MHKYLQFTDNTRSVDDSHDEFLANETGRDMLCLMDPLILNVLY